MSFLLDTEAWIHFVRDSAEMPAEFRDQLERAGLLFLSCVSVWEIARKDALYRRQPTHPSPRAIRLEVTFREWARRAIPAGQIEVLPLSVEISAESNSLPGSFGNDDPFDQIIVATARVHDLTAFISTTESSIRISIHGTTDTPDVAWIGLTDVDHGAIGEGHAPGSSGPLWASCSLAVRRRSANSS